MSQNHHTVLIVGGGAAGVSLANNMHRKNNTIDIAIIEPSENHYYQPGFTIIGMKSDCRRGVGANDAGWDFTGVSETVRQMAVEIIGVART